MQTTLSGRVGYGRVSTADQNTDLQVDALTDAGCSRVFLDHASGTLRERPELAKALDYIRPGDALVVWRLDRLARSLTNLLSIVELLTTRDVGLVSLTEAIESTSPSGKLMMHVFGAIGQFERDLIVERTNAGLAAARARGRVGGRRPVLTGERLRAALQMYDSGSYSLTAIALTVGVSRATIYRAVSARNEAR